MEFAELVHELRGEVIENVHYGAICVVDERGKVVHRSGDPEHMTFLRSAAKPFQAIPVMKRRIPEIYELTGGETALFAGSHRGEEYHIAALESMYRKIRYRRKFASLLRYLPVERARQRSSSSGARAETAHLPQLFGQACWLDRVV